MTHYCKHHSLIASTPPINKKHKNIMTLNMKLEVKDNAPLISVAAVVT